MVGINCGIVEAIHSYGIRVCHGAGLTACGLVIQDNVEGDLGTWNIGVAPRTTPGCVNLDRQKATPLTGTQYITEFSSAETTGLEVAEPASRADAIDIRVSVGVLTIAGTRKNDKLTVTRQREVIKVDGTVRDRLSRLTEWES